MGFRRALRGIGRFRRLLRRLPGAVGNEIVVELNVTGRTMLAAILARTPHRRGNLASGVSQKVLPRSLRLQIGLLGTRAGRSKLFYGRIQDLGRAQQVVRVTRRVKQRTLIGNNRGGNVRRTLFAATSDRLRRRGPNKGTPVGSPYTMRVRAMKAKRFITGRYAELRAELRANLRGMFGRALKAAGGGSDD